MAPPTAQQPTLRTRSPSATSFKGGPAGGPTSPAVAPTPTRRKMLGWTVDGKVMGDGFNPICLGRNPPFLGRNPHFWWFNSTILGVSLFGLKFVQFNLQALPKPRRGFWPRCNSRAAGGLYEVASIFHGFTYEKWIGMVKHSGSLSRQIFT